MYSHRARLILLIAVAALLVVLVGWHFADEAAGFLRQTAYNQPQS